MSTILLRCVVDCFQRTPRLEGMHCLGAVTGGTPSPNGIGSRGGILSVFRALGVLVCEGRIQGPPRGYKEGPHCAPPMQAIPAGHVCEEDNNYLCERYLLLVREITDRTAIGSYLCVEVVLCSDCPCGLAKATCKNPICPVPSLSISPWQQSSEMLLEYWCIYVVPSKSPETMNFQGLYQAVRSRLHFSQVAAWWSRSNGTEPSCIATRVVQYNEDNLRKFREAPVEHTFPLAGSGDGTSIKVTVWALPRMEEVPILTCPIHPPTTKEKDEEGVVARALTPTKGIPVPTAPQNPESLVMPALVDDRLQTPCNKPGKHHCRCEEEDGSPPSPSIPRPNGERKRRRSLPCGPADVNSCVTFQPMPLPSVQESTSRESGDFSPGSSYHSSFPDASLVSDGQVDKRGQAERQSQARYGHIGFRHRNNVNTDDLERCFRTQLNIEEREGNVEKRYKRTLETPEEARPSPNRADENGFLLSGVRNSPSPDRGKINGTTAEARQERNGLFENLIPFNSSLPWSFVESWNNSAANGKCAFQSLRAAKDSHLNEASRLAHTPRKDPSALSLDSLAQTSPFRDSGSEYGARTKLDPNSTACTVHQSCTKVSGKAANAVSPANEALPEAGLESGGTKSRGRQRDLSHLMSKLSFAEEKEKAKEEGGFLDWFSRVPGRVLGVSPSNGFVDSKAKAAAGLRTQEQRQNANNEVKFKNCNLELSQREFDEVLAVLRAGTPSGRKRAPVKTVKRRDRGDRSLDESVSEKCLSKCTANGLENGGDGSSGYIVGHAKLTCEMCRNRLCKRTDHLNPEKSVAVNQTAAFGKGVHYSCAKSDKFCNSSVVDETRGTKCSSPDKRTSNAVDCLQNVSNKADVLLGAILRTSKERKGLSDISNGTRPRTALPTTRNDDESNPQPTNADKGSQDSRIVPFEDEKSSPLSLNKRFNRFRQLFKKEQEKKVTSDCYIQSANLPNAPPQRLNTPNPILNQNNVQPNLHESKHPRDGSRVKRKIDFSKFAEENGAPDKRSQETSEFSTNGAHQNSSIHSTNFTENGCVHAADDSLLGCRNCQGDHGRLHSTNSGMDEEEDVLDETVGSFKLHKDPTAISASSFTPLTNGHSSPPSSRSNNSKEGVCVDDEETVDKAVPSAIEQERFRRSLENAASMVFHSRTGLPLTSSPAPLRRGSCCFDYDSSLNSVSSKRSALFELNTPPSPGAVSLEETDKETENAGEGEETPKRRTTSRNRPQSHALLGSFEESALNGRLEPVSTVHGFTAELGASGSFCPKHRKLPVTVFFYTLGDNDKVSTPYLAHINLGKKGYAVPKNGTIQVTLLNPLGTVVKMFVVLYDLSDMPPRSHTFLRQRTLRDKTLRYLVHLRFMSNKSGRISLHTDIRMIICRKSDVDTASDFGSEPPKELRSYIHGPTNPKFSPRC